MDLEILNLALENPNVNSQVKKDLINFHNLPLTAQAKLGEFFVARKAPTQSLVKALVEDSISLDDQLQVVTIERDHLSKKVGSNYDPELIKDLSEYALIKANKGDERMGRLKGRMQARFQGLI